MCGSPLSERFAASMENHHGQNGNSTVFRGERLLLRQRHFTADEVRELEDNEDHLPPRK
jgi:hypothetical protein